MAHQWGRIRNLDLGGQRRRGRRNGGGHDKPRPGVLGIRNPPPTTWWCRVCPTGPLGEEPSGTPCLQMAHGPSTVVLDLSSLPGGVYLLQSENAQGEIKGFRRSWWCAKARRLTAPHGFFVFFSMRMHCIGVCLRRSLGVLAQVITGKPWFKTVPLGITSCPPLSRCPTGCFRISGVRMVAGHVWVRLRRWRRRNGHPCFAQHLHASRV